MFHERPAVGQENPHTRYGSFRPIADIGASLQTKSMTDRGGTNGRCLIATSKARSLVAIILVPAIFLQIHSRWVVFGGWPLFDFRHLLHPNDVSLWVAIVLVVLIVLWAVRYLPHSLRTLRGGSCALAVHGDSLVFYGRATVPLAEVERIEAVNNLFHKGVVITLSSGRTTYVSTIMARLAPKTAMKKVQSCLRR